MFDIILADLPLFYNNRKAGGERLQKTKFGGGAMKHYPLMKDNDLLNLKPYIDSISNKDCALFLWVTMPKLDFCMEFMKYCGFKYKTMPFVWVKTYSKSGTIVQNPGFYTASNAEAVILGTKGKTSRYFEPSKKMIQQVVLSPRLKHSQKPEDIQDKIDLMYPSYKKLELFARRQKNGWTCLGNEITGNDIRIDLANLKNNIS